MLMQMQRPFWLKSWIVEPFYKKRLRDNVSSDPLLVTLSSSFILSCFVWESLFSLHSQAPAYSSLPFILPSPVITCCRHCFLCTHFFAISSSGTPGDLLGNPSWETLSLCIWNFYSVIYTTSLGPCPLPLGCWQFLAPVVTFVFSWHSHYDTSWWGKVGKGSVKQGTVFRTVQMIQRIFVFPESSKIVAGTVVLLGVCRSGPGHVLGQRLSQV